MSAIPISEYINIKSKVVGGSVKTRDFSGLVFSANAMKAKGASIDVDPYYNIKTDYAAGKSVALSLNDIEQCFADGDVKDFAKKYFSYNGGNAKPTTLNVALILAGDNSPITAFNRVTSETINFGTVTILCEVTTSTSSAGKYTIAQLKAVAESNEALDAENTLIVCIKPTDVTTLGTNLDGFKFTHVVVANDKFGSWMPMAWYASVDYDNRDASAAIDYKQFAGEEAAVTTKADKTAYDTKHLNYMGKVQVYGTGLSFYQKGVNMNGDDLGVIRDSSWIKGLITVEYFNLQSSVSKIPANYVGCAMVRNIVVNAATRGIENGAILLDKPLDNEKIAIINSYAGTDEAAGIVAATGYYVDVKIVKNGNDFVCEYTLIYAKGDHIAKVNGSHVLV